MYIREMKPTTVQKNTRDEKDNINSSDTRQAFLPKWLGNVYHFYVQTYQYQLKLLRKKLKIL